MVWERRDPNEPLDWEEGWEALTAVWTEPCFGTYAAQQPPERRTNYTPRDFTEAYTIVWDLATQRVPWNFAEEVYEHYQQALARFAHAQAAHGLAQSASDVRCLLLEFGARWAQHRALVADYYRAFVILDRYYVKHNGLVPLEPAGRRCFWKAACTPHVRARLREAILALVEQHKGPMLERAQQQAAAAAAAAASKEAAEAEAEAKRRRRGGSGRGFAPSSVWAKEAEFAAQCKGWEGGEKGEEMAVQQGVAPPPAPGPAELGAALAGLVVSYLEEASPDAFDELNAALRAATDNALDARQVAQWGKEEGWQAMVLSRPFPGVLPLGPSQVSFFYRLHLQKLRCLSEGLLTTPTATPAQPQQPQPPAAAAVASHPSMQVRAGSGGGVMMEVEEEGPRMTIHVAAARAAVGREGEGEARCGVVLREVVVGMGDDVFRELLEHLHVL